MMAVIILYYWWQEPFCFDAVLGQPFLFDGWVGLCSVIVAFLGYLQINFDTIKNSRPLYFENNQKQKLYHYFSV